MSAASQYYKSDNNHSLYQAYPSRGRNQLYVTPWQQITNYASYEGPSPASFLHDSQGGGESVSHGISPTQGSPTGHARQISNVVWPQSIQSQNVVPRPLNSYGYVVGSAPVHQTHEPSRQFHQHVSATRPDLSLSQAVSTYKGSQQFSEAKTPSDFPANSDDPPFTTHAQGTHALPKPLYPQSCYTSSHIGSGLQQPLQTSAEMPWTAGFEPSRHQQYPVHTSNTLESGLGQTASSAPAWHMEHVGNLETTTLMFHPDQPPNDQWSATQTQSEHQAYQQQLAPFDQYAESLGDPSSSRRSSTKKKTVSVPSSFVQRQEKLKVSKRKGPLHEKQRQKANTMRKTMRICVRCRFYKSGCDEGDPCEKCDKITRHARSFREPCYREHLENTSLVRRCNGGEHQEEAEFLEYDWVHNSQLFEMEILWNLPGYGPIPNAQPMRVTFRPYSPRRGSLDVANSVWTNKEGEVKAVEQPGYAIYDTANLVLAFECYFSSLQPGIEDWIFARTQQDEIATLTYSEVLRMRRSNGSKVLDLAIRLQCLSVVSQGYGSVWSNDIHGIREYDYRSLGSSDYEAYDRKRYDRPLSGAITHQMDVAALKYLWKLEKFFVKELAALIFKPKIKPWYELFLAFYVIFWNLEYIRHCADEYIKSNEGTVIKDQVKDVVNTQIKKWELAFSVLLYHWKCVLRGYSPFKLARENPEELREKGHIDAEGFQYVAKVADIFARVDADLLQPPLTGLESTHYSLSSEWIIRLIKEAGA